MHCLMVILVLTAPVLCEEHAQSADEVVPEMNDVEVPAPLSRPYHGSPAL